MRRTAASVAGFLARVPDEQRREDARRLCAMMQEIRRQHLAIYLVGEFTGRHHSVLARLGPHQTGKGCLYLERLDDVDHDALHELIDRSVRVRKGIGRAST